MTSDVDPVVEAELRSIASAFLAGRELPLETAFALSKFVGEAPAQISRCLDEVAGVASQTDHILLGVRRSLWAPTVRVKEDQKHDEAQAWAKPIVQKACEALIAAL
jgi:hypothetical protein